MLTRSLAAFSLFALTACGGGGRHATPPAPQRGAQPGPAEVKPGGDRPGWVRCPSCALRVCVDEDKVRDPDADIAGLVLSASLPDEFKKAFPGAEIVQTMLMVSKIGEDGGAGGKVDGDALSDGDMSLPLDQYPSLSPQEWSDYEGTLSFDLSTEDGPWSVQMPIDVKVEACAPQ